LIDDRTVSTGDCPVKDSNVTHPHGLAATTARYRDRKRTLRSGRPTIEIRTVTAQLPSPAPKVSFHTGLGIQVAQVLST
jgi:hypothetical protein